jgi:NNP family nitrate/nitrite transporter-like MFS transporter
MKEVTGNPGRALFAATLGFFAGFAAVALFGPTASRFQSSMQLGPMAVGLLVAIPALSGSLLRIPFAAWVDSTGGRQPFLVLLALSLVGMAGLTGLVALVGADQLGVGFFPLVLIFGVLSGCGIATFTVGISQVAYWFSPQRQGRALAVFAGVGNLAPGLFSFLLPAALAGWGLAGCYVAWLAFLAIGTLLYAMLGHDAPYFQLLRHGEPPDRARASAMERGQEMFPSGNLIESLRISARTWQTWALVLVYFSTFGGFIALTAWLPTYWRSFFACSALTAGSLTALYSLLTSLIRIIGGVLADELQEGGENTAILALFIMLAGALVMTSAREFELAVPGVILLACGMGICNAAVFKLVPQAVPQAVGGASGWVGGLGAFGGFVLPPVLAFAVGNLGEKGYAIGFVIFIFLALISLAAVWVLKYTRKWGVATVSASSFVEPRRG